MEKSATLIALFGALIAALGLIPQITLAFGVPITAQSLGVMLCGTVLGARRFGSSSVPCSGCNWLAAFVWRARRPWIVCLTFRRFPDRLANCGLCNRLYR